MASEWFVKRNGQTAGPFTSQQLRQLAASGRLTPADLIRQGDSGSFVPASKARVLFAEAVPKKIAGNLPPLPASLTSIPDAPLATDSEHSAYQESTAEGRKELNLIAMQSGVAGAGLGLAYGVLFGGLLTHGVVGGILGCIVAWVAHAKAPSIQLTTAPAKFVGVVLLGLFLVGRVPLGGGLGSGQDWAASGPKHAKADRPTAAETREAASQRPPRSWLWGQRPTRFELLSLLQDYSDESVKMNGRIFLDQDPPFGRVEGNCVETFLEEFRNPDEDISALPNEHTLKDSHRWWVYECSDGLLRFRVELGPQLGSRSFSMRLDAKENIPK